MDRRDFLKKLGLAALAAPFLPAVVDQAVAPEPVEEEALEVQRLNETLPAPSEELQGDSVYALAFGPEGELYIGGDFCSVGAATCSKIATWNGSSWSALH